MSVKIEIQELTAIPDASRFDGTLLATVLHFEPRPILILEEAATHQGPPLDISVDYFIPAALARLGLPVKLTRVWIKTPGQFDHNIIEVVMPGIATDPWGMEYAGDGPVQWLSPGAAFLGTVLGHLGIKTSQHIGRFGLFMGTDMVTRRCRIAQYDGSQYWDDHGDCIPGELVQVEDCDDR